MKFNAEGRSSIAKPTDIALSIGLFVVVLSIYSTEWFDGFLGGVSLVGAERIMAGEVLYRDFWTMYAPGHFYLAALVFYLFGKHIVVDAIAGSLVSAAAAWIHASTVVPPAGSELLVRLRGAERIHILGFCSGLLIG